MSGTIPEWALSGSVVVTLFTVMFGLALGIAPGELRWTWRRPRPMATQNSAPPGRRPRHGRGLSTPLRTRCEPG
ncbi:MAG TPA: hypothetical protein VLC55_02795 [Burkholderiales bacterium]|nr:hypothetical protein [Burkholderiales bacterium]